MLALRPGRGHLEIFDEFRRQINASRQQPVTRTRTGDVQQISFGIVHFLKIRIVADRLDSLLQGMTSSSQAITTTALNSSPLARDA
jgi:hypothetical protein